MKTKITSWTSVALLLVACHSNPETAEQATTAAGEKVLTTPEEPTQDTFQDLPAGALTETFEDTPGVVRVVVKNGANFSLLGSYKNKKREGNWVEYHPNGLVKSITPYVNGKIEGLYVELGNNGTLEKRCQYHNGMRHGEYKEFNYATVKEERTYVNDKLEGLVKVYYPNGKLMEEGSYKNGTRDGLSKWYDQNGNLSIEYEYKNGELVKK